MRSYENKSHEVATRQRFTKRIIKHALLALLMISIALVIGMIGYMTLGGMNLVDAFLNASMILSGMGPVGELRNDNVKIFAGIYAIASGLLFVAIAGLLLAPVFHRILHLFHADDH